MKLKEAIYQDFWIHFGASLAIVIGAVSWYQMNQMHNDPSSISLLFMVGGLAAMGVKIVNGSSSLLRAAVAIAKTEPVPVTVVVPPPAETPAA